MPFVVLVGPPGAGKTTVGELLAARHELAFRDTDRDIEATAGRTIADIFVEDGEPAFRALERAAVRDALLTHEGVLALGGGAVMADETRALLRGHRVVFLDVGLAAAVDRVGINRSRPLLAMNPRAELARMLTARRPLYEEVATATVLTDDLDPEAVVDTVDAALVTA
jgi:shikimate kinase